MFLGTAQLWCSSLCLFREGADATDAHFCFLLQMMQTNIPGVFAAGDAVTFPLSLRNNKKVNVPHWQMAHMHGRCFTAPWLRNSKLLMGKSLFHTPRRFPNPLARE